jgi:uncharacterized protein YkwD
MNLKNVLGYVELEVVSNWMLTTLGACRKLGFNVPEDKLEKPIKFIADCCNEGKGDVGYSPRPGQKGFGAAYRTGGAIFAFAMLGKEDHPLYPLMIQCWKRSAAADSNEGHGSVALGYIGSALGARQVSPEDWQLFRDTFFPQILAHAQKDGSFKHITGKTPLSVGFDDKQGPAYNTGIYALLLQLDGGRLRFVGQRLDPLWRTAESEKIAKAVLKAAGDFRKTKKLEALEISEALTALAQRHAYNMAREDRFGDDDKDGHFLFTKDFEDRLAAAKLSYEAAGENVGLVKGGTAPASAVMATWKRSKETSAVLLSEQATEIGLGVAQGPSQRWYFCLVVGKPKQ